MSLGSGRRGDGETSNRGLFPIPATVVQDGRGRKTAAWKAGFPSEGVQGGGPLDSPVASTDGCSRAPGGQSSVRAQVCAMGDKSQKSKKAGKKADRAKKQVRALPTLGDR